MNQKIERYFVWIVLLFSATALIYPHVFMAFKSFIPFGLGLIMFGIGMNMSWDNLAHTLSRPKKAAWLVIVRYLIMPFCAWGISRCFQLTPMETIGILILGTVPGGTAANVMAYLASSNVALAVLLTFGSTLLSPILTPTLIYGLLHQHITIHFWDMVLHIVMIILVPVVAGLLLNRLKKDAFMGKIKTTMPSISILLVAFLIACIFSLNQAAILKLPLMLIVAVTCLNLMGYAFGALTAYCLKLDRESMLATAFDYGMFDAAVAMVICTTFFPPETAVPAALLSIIQNLTAPLLVRYLKQTIAIDLTVFTPFL